MLQHALGKRIAEIRRERKLTQEQLAERCGYSVEFVSLFERGINAPTVAGIERIAKVLKVKPKELFTFPEY